MNRLPTNGHGFWSLDKFDCVQLVAVIVNVDKSLEESRFIGSPFGFSQLVPTYDNNSIG